MSFKPDGKVFGIDARAGELLDFPDVSRGWGVTLEQTGSKPPIEWMNGAFKRVDQNQKFQSMTGARYPFDQTYSDEIGGYPQGAILLSADGQTMWQSTVDANATDPDSAEASGWVRASGVRNIKTIVMNSSGTYTPTAGTQFIIVEGVGGGGAGGGALVTTSNNVSCGGGGGGGGYCKTRLAINEISGSVEVTVGAKGIGVNGATGGDGSGTTFGSFFSAEGGLGGLKAGQSPGAFAAQGGAGGLASGGNILNSHGSQGITGFANYGSYVIPGQGGDSVLGCGGRFMFIATGGAGHNGAGGGGVAIGTGATGSYIGGDGGDGVVIITEYIF